MITLYHQTMPSINSLNKKKGALRAPRRNAIDWLEFVKRERCISVLVGPTVHLESDKSRCAPRSSLRFTDRNYRYSNQWLHTIGMQILILFEQSTALLS